MSFARTRPPVKPYRNTRKTPAPFGFGILRWVPTYRSDHTAADSAWFSDQVNNVATPIDLDFDRRASEAEAVAAHEQGITYY